MLEFAAGNHVVPHFLANPLSTWLARAGRHQADGLHPFGPFLVVVARPARRAEVPLPKVRHFMHQGLEHFHWRYRREVFRVERDFIRLAAVPPAEALLREVAIGPLQALESDQTVRQPAVEQRLVVEVVSLLQLGIGFFGRSNLAHLCIVQYIS